MSETKKMNVLRGMAAVGVALTLLWSCAAAGWVHAMSEQPETERLVLSVSVIWMAGASLGGIALAFRRSRKYLIGLMTMIPALTALIVLHLIRFLL